MKTRPEATQRVQFERTLPQEEIDTHYEVEQLNAKRMKIENNEIGAARMGVNNSGDPNLIKVWNDLAEYKKDLLENDRQLENKYPDWNSL